MNRICIIIFVLTTSCNADKEQNTAVVSETKSEKSFMELLEDVNDLNFPLELDCFNQLNNESTFNQLEPYFPNEGKLIGKTFFGTKPLLLFTFPCDISSCPHFYSFTKDGEIIDSLHLFNGTCAGDPWSESSCKTRISEKIDIFQSDTLRLYLFNDTLRKLDSTLLINSYYRLNDNGRFMNINVDTLLLEKN